MNDEGRVLGLTRAGIWVLLVLAAANGLFLYLAPGQADTDYAWSIKPPVNAAFIGAGFLAGTLATGLVLALATRWRSFSTLPVALWVLATSLLAATIIHNDRFKWDYPPTWVWTFVYAAVPLASRSWSCASAATRTPTPAADPRLLPLRVLSAILGVGLLAGAIALFAAPVELGEHWLWALTPLLARAVAAWYALFGTLLVSCAIGLRRPAEALIPYATLACWSVLLLLLPLLHPDDVSGGGLWYALMVALLALSAYALSVGAARRARTSSRRRWPRARRARERSSAARASSPEIGSREGRHRELGRADDRRPLPDPLEGLRLAAEEAGQEAHLAVLGGRRCARGLNGQDTRRQDGHKRADAPGPARACRWRRGTRARRPPPRRPRSPPPGTAGRARARAARADARRCAAPGRRTPPRTRAAPRSPGRPRSPAPRRSANSHGSASPSAITHATSAAGTRKRAALGAVAARSGPARSAPPASAT